MKNILIGITSSIASYKIYELIRLFKKNGYNVKTIVTENALNFISPLVLETLSKDKCYYKQFDAREDVEHIHLINWADIFIIAPISANTISKFATGLADNLLTSVFCAYMGTQKPILIAPAMNTNMLNNPIVQMNLDILETYCEIAHPESGYLACDEIGKGRLCDINEIYLKALRLLYQDKNNNSKKMIVTLGGTREPIDTVRFISNSSSGKMGSAICDEAYIKGFEVLAISTIELNKPYSVINVSTAEEMLQTLEQCNFDYLIMSAAVADFKVEDIAKEKISKENLNKKTTYFQLTLNPDIVSTIASKKRENQKVIGFCLTDHDLIETAKKKLTNKKLDFIVANDISALENNENKVTIIDKSGKIVNIDKDTKQNIAKKILEVVCD